MKRTIEQRRAQMRWVRLAVAGLALGGLLSFLYALRIPATYEARVSMLVGPPMSSATISLADIELGQALAPLYAELATTRPVLRNVIEAVRVATTPDDLSKAVTAVVDSNVLTVIVTFESAESAAAIANGVAAQLSEVGPGPTTDGPGGFLSVVDPAVPPTVAAGPRPLSTMAIGAGIGLLIGIGVAFLFENLRRADELLSDPA